MNAIFDLTPLLTAFPSIVVGVLVCVALGLIVGCVSAMFGIGGGFVITPFFHSVLGLSAPLAVASSMGQIACMSLSGFVEYARQRKIRYRAAALLLLGAIPSAQLIAILLSALVPSATTASAGQTSNPTADLAAVDLLLVVAFGLFLGVVGLYNIKRARSYPVDNARQRDAQSANDRTPAAEQNAGAVRESEARPGDRPLLTIAVGVLFGAVAALLGIGGGFFAVPYFVYGLKFEPAEGVATSFFCILLTSVFTTAQYLWLGNIYFGLSLCVALGSVFGAQLGSRFAVNIAPQRLLMSLGLLQLFVMGAYLALKL